MKVVFDTSVLVPALVASHPAHGRAFVWLEAVRRQSLSGAVAWHGLAELWSVLTRFPLVPAVAPADATAMVERLASLLEVLPMTAGVYRLAFERATTKRVRSGALFDALHLAAAEKASADAFVTLNPLDFERLAAEGSPRIVVPPDPPRVSLK